ncbi:MAG: S41 family peptidase [Planctomycetaceae bacterium]|nr:S41 family peptidase [Planctomycetaceae bacterium]
MSNPLTNFTSPVRTAPWLRSGSLINLTSPPERPGVFQTASPLPVQDGNLQNSAVSPQSSSAYPQEKLTNTGIQEPAATYSTGPNPVNPLSSIRPKTDEEKVNEILQQGQILVQNRQWKDALILYQNAIRNHRKVPLLMEKYRLALFHYEIDRRYEDKSFLTLLTSMSFTDTLALYDDVMLKIQINHVDPPHWLEMLHYGLSDLGIAMQSDIFRAQNEITVPKETLALQFQQMQTASSTWKIDNSLTLRNQVLRIVDYCQRENGISPTAALFEFLCGISNSLDPHTAFLTLNQYNDTMGIIRGNFAGLGIEFTSDKQPFPFITRVIAGSPAERAGLKKGDRILIIDGVPADNMTLDQAANLLQGPINSIANLQVQSRDLSVRDVSIRREQVKVLSIEECCILDDYISDIKVGYIRLSGFQQETVLELQTALSNLYYKGMQYLILDLRRNPGGVLTEAISAADLFIKRGVIVRTRSRSIQGESVHSANPNRATWDVPLCVLIDEDSASASEIFAGAIHDNRRGLIIGKRSYGKDTVQAVYALYRNNNSQEPVAGLKLTIETFYSPNGVPYTGVGVVPDIVVENYPRKYMTAEDSSKHTASRPIEGQIMDILPLSEDNVIRVAVEEIQRQMTSASRSSQDTKNR